LGGLVHGVGNQPAAISLNTAAATGHRVRGQQPRDPTSPVFSTICSRAREDRFRRGARTRVCELCPGSIAFKGMRSLHAVTPRSRGFHHAGAEPRTRTSRPKRTSRMPPCTPPAFRQGSKPAQRSRSARSRRVVKPSRARREESVWEACGAAEPWNRNSVKRVERVWGGSHSFGLARWSPRASSRESEGS